MNNNEIVVKANQGLVFAKTVHSTDEVDGSVSPSIIRTSENRVLRKYETVEVAYNQTPVINNNKRGQNYASGWLAKRGSIHINGDDYEVLINGDKNRSILMEVCAGERNYIKFRSLSPVKAAKHPRYTEAMTNKYGGVVSIHKKYTDVCVSYVAKPLVHTDFPVPAWWLQMSGAKLDTQLASAWYGDELVIKAPARYCDVCNKYIDSFEGHSFMRLCTPCADTLPVLSEILIKKLGTTEEIFTKAMLEIADREAEIIALIRGK